MDQDSTSGKFAHEQILQAFRSGLYNVLLGTQMVAKGHDIPCMEKYLKDTYGITVYQEQVM